ncbi:MAG: glycoside hydrolase family 108 protein [Limnohabitans sp.]
MKEKLEAMLQKEKLVIEFYKSQVTIDPPLTVARIRAELLRELLQAIPDTAGKGPHSPATVQKWLVRILGHEGGYWDDQVGGPTKWGISKRSYPDLDIPALTVEDAEVIYRRDFLAPLQVNRYEDGLAFQLLDFAVNSGQQTAIKVLQRALGLNPDGLIGSKTLATIAGKSESDLVMIVIAARLQFMASLKNWDSNSEGWANRMARNLLSAAEDTD